MKTKKVTLKSVRNELKNLKQELKLEESIKKNNALEAIEILRVEVGTVMARRMFLEMSLRYVNDPEVSIDESEICTLLSIHEILNVL